MQVHFFRDYENPKNRMSKVREVDFVPENLEGQVVPVEIKFRRTVHESDFAGLNTFIKRFGPRYGVMVTRETYNWRPDLRILCVPLLEFLLAF